MEKEIDMLRFSEIIMTYGWIIAIILVIAGGVWTWSKLMSIEQPEIGEDWQEVEHCLVWGKDIDRNTLMLACVNFAEQDLYCHWQVQSDLSVVVWDVGEEENATVIPCTKKITVLQYTGESDGIIEQER